MPPATPSPHRFLPGRKQDSSVKDGKKSAAPSFPRGGDGFDGPTRKSATKTARFVRPVAASSGDGFSLSTPQAKSSSKQFAQTPRFGSARPDTPAVQAPSFEPAAILRPHVRPTEEVEEALSQETHDDDEMLELEHEQSLPLTERVDDDRAWTQDLPHSPKRRRLDNVVVSSESTLLSPARHSMFKQPTTPASALHSGPQQFTRASSVASSAADEGSSVRRPAFLSSSVAPAEHHEPLPEAFSPHRRGEKFVPGGMAATLQQWVMETGQAAAQSRRGQGYLNGEAYLHRVTVQARSGSSPMLVQGILQDDTQAWFILLSDGKRTSYSDVAPGSIVGVRAPCWEVALEARSWLVGVDWKLLT